MSFPSTLNLTTKPAAVPARSYRINISPINGAVFQPGSTIKFDIPTGGATFLDNKQSFLKLRYSNTGTTPQSLNGSALGAISRLEIFHGGQLLETISDYNVLAQAFVDATASSSWRSAQGAAMWGTSSNLATGSTISNGASGVFCVPLMSGIIGAHLSKYLPLALMDSAPLRVELTLANATGGMTSSTDVAPAWEVSDVEYVAQVTELSADAMRMLRSAMPAVVEVSSESFRAYNFVVGSGVASVSELIPAKFSSLKGIYSAFRKVSDLTANNLSAVGRFMPTATPESMTSQYRVGPLNIPQKPIAGVREHCAELMKSFHAVSDVAGGGVISYTNYSGAAFLMGQELESFAHSSDTIEAGMNTLSQSVYLDVTIPGGASAAARLDVFAHFDQFLVISNGLASVRF